MSYIKNRLILLRHGESEWNLQNKFTGWTDVGLSEKGKKEAEKAGQLLTENKLTLDLVYVSYLKRAINTNKICLNILKNENPKIIKDWRLNERHYGDLQGLNKSETSIKFGEEQVHIWRRSYDISPPKLSKSDERHPRHDKLYRDINPKELPSGESLKDTLNRVKPLWLNDIMPSIKEGKNLIIVAHGNSLRAIMKIIKNISDNEIVKLNIPTGAPYVFEFSNELKVLRDYYLGDKKEVSKKANLVANQASSKN